MTLSDERHIQRFEVSLKGFIVRDGRALFLREADSGYWEIPGGRIDAGEEWVPHADVLAREVREELGTEIRIAFGKTAVTWTRQRPSDGVFLFILARIGVVIGGEPRLSAEHSEMAWLDRSTARRLAFPPSSSYSDAIERLWNLADGRASGG
jgi:8-oxo-dGTP pyrophosphatase MutT (NUDIX family)